MKPEVKNPIINSPFGEPTRHWKIRQHEPAELLEERRTPTYFYTPPGTPPVQQDEKSVEIKIPEIEEIRKRLGEWRKLALKGEGGVTRTTMELMNYWRRDGRKQPLFFAQLEAAETIIFLHEARADFLQGIDIVPDKPHAENLKSLQRYCCKMATGTGKTTVMAMLVAWSILNKVCGGGKHYSDAVLVVCPNVTIRERLSELDPKKGDAGIYCTRDLVPRTMMPLLAKGKFLTVNWHVFEPQNPSGGKVVKAGKKEWTTKQIHISDKTQSARGKRYMTEDDLRKKSDLGLLEIVGEIRGKKVTIREEKYIESDAALVRRAIGRALGGKQNILVLNDEAHHAYRIKRDDDGDEDLFGDEDAARNYYQEATVWVDGLDKINAQRGINYCLDFSATPYFLGRAGEDTNRIFPWTVSNFDLRDAIESGLVKIPQLAVRDPSGDAVPGYFNIWKWILPQLTIAERGGKKSDAQPEAVLKYAHTPIAILGGLWEKMRQEWAKSDDPRPPVFIIVCKTTKLAKVVYEWLAEDKPPMASIPSAHLAELRNGDGAINTIRVDSKVQKEVDSGNSKTNEVHWMRHTLNTIGKQQWPMDSQKRAIYPSDFEQLADKLGRSKHPPGRDVRCIVSVGMLTEGWDCNTVTHIIGLRPFMSQLLCEQIVGRGLRRASYEIGDDGLMSEEIATVLGVPLSSFPVKATGEGAADKQKPRHHIYALPEKKRFEIKFPRVEGYRQSIKHKLKCNMDHLPPLTVDGRKIPPEVEMKAGLPDNKGRMSLHGPGKVDNAGLKEFRAQQRLQQRIFELAGSLAQHYQNDKPDQLPANELFRQLCRIVADYIDKKVTAADKKDAFLSPYYGDIVEHLRQHIQPDVSAGDSPELPRYEKSRGDGSTGEVDFYTKRNPYDVIKSHINAVVPDTQNLEQEAAYCLDRHPKVECFAKNEGLGFGIPYLHNGQMHDYLPDFIVRLKSPSKTPSRHLILETKGYPDARKEDKAAAAQRWVEAVNADKKHGEWRYAIVDGKDKIPEAIDSCFLE